MDFFDIAYEEALIAYNNGEVPVGCVIVKNGEIIARYDELNDDFRKWGDMVIERLQEVFVFQAAPSLPFPSSFSIPQVLHGKVVPDRHAVSFLCPPVS